MDGDDRIPRALAQIKVGEIGKHEAHPLSDAALLGEALRLGQADGGGVHTRAVVSQRGQMHDVAALPFTQ